MQAREGQANMRVDKSESIEAASRQHEEAGNKQQQPTRRQSEPRTPIVRLHGTEMKAVKRKPR